MAKVVQFIRIQKCFSFFSDQEIIQLAEEFNNSPLGKIHLSIPWDKLSKIIKKKYSTKGKSPLFSLQGEIALMILKSYTQLSDKQLAEQINCNLQYQMFCGLPLRLTAQIKDYKMISRIRVKLSHIMDWDKFQEILINFWSCYIENKGHILMDATCYESDMRYPTEAKLLYESLEYIYKKLCKECKQARVKKPRSKYKELKREYIIYSRLKKKSYKKTQKIIKKLIYLSKKLYHELERMQGAHGIAKQVKQTTVEKVLEQQEKKNNGEKIEGQILSLNKPYVRSIVRGKEIKRTEFGAKVHKVQIDGINIVEKIEFENFHEGIRYEETIEKWEKLTKTKVTITGADAIYATNDNRNYATKRGIKTDFKPKGRPGKDSKAKKQLSNIIRKARGSRLEGSFGVEKRVYGLGRIKGRTKETEILWIYIGIYTKNMLEIGRRMCKTSKAGPPKEKRQKVA